MGNEVMNALRGARSRPEQAAVVGMLEINGRVTTSTRGIGDPGSGYAGHSAAMVPR